MWGQTMSQHQPLFAHHLTSDNATIVLLDSNAFLPIGFKNRTPLLLSRFHHLVSMLTIHLTDESLALHSGVVFLLNALFYQTTIL